VLVAAAIPAAAPAKSAATAATPTGTAAEKAPPPVLINWRKDLAAARKEAVDSGGILFYFFSADWCQACRIMEHSTFVNRAIAQYINTKFIPVRIDDSKDTSQTTTKYQVTVYPSILFVGPGDDPLHMMVGPWTASELYPIMLQVEALPTLIEAQKKKPDDLEANFAVGDALAKLEHLKRAEPYLKRAAGLAPKNENGRLSQARLYLALVPIEDGDTDRTIKNIDQWLLDFKDAPEVVTAIFFQGAILFKEGKYDAARPYFERIRKEFPKHPKAFDADQAIAEIDARLKFKAAVDAKAIATPTDAPAASTTTGTGGKK
jgi:tetratricopeptide (TPR) repeat protein